MLKERNERCGNGSNLLRRNIHEVNIHWRNYWEVGILTALHHVANECSIIVKWSITLSDNVVFLLLCCQIYHLVVVEVCHTIFHLSVWGLDKSKLIDLCINTKRRD